MTGWHYITLYLTITVRTSLESSVSKSGYGKNKATSEQLNSTRRPQLGNRGNGMSETEGKREKLRAKMERHFSNIDKSKAQMSLVLHNYSLQEYAPLIKCTGQFADVYSGTDIMNVTSKLKHIWELQFSFVLKKKHLSYCLFLSAFSGVWD